MRGGEQPISMGGFRTQRFRGRIKGCGESRQAIRQTRTEAAHQERRVKHQSGVAMQGLFRNPLADPGLVGVSSGAALGAALAIVFGASLGGLPAFLAPYLL
ncbi:iron chelate uptake ABC transporter family permease subunit, partial [Pseudomonas aeruginosa]